MGVLAVVGRCRSVFQSPDSPDEDPDTDENLCALEWAALHKHFDIFKLKKIKISPDHPIAGDLLQKACWADKSEFSG